MNTKTQTINQLKNLAQKLPEKLPYVQMLILFGSRARGDIHEKSDWDFAIFYDQQIREKCLENRPYGWFADSIYLNKIFNLNTENIDIVELNNCSDFIAHYIARDGILLYEKNLGDFATFKHNKLKTKTEINAISQKMRTEIEEFLEKCGV